MRYFNAAVEGRLDAVVVRRIVVSVGAEMARDPFVKGGRQEVLRNLESYMHAAQIGPWIVMCDLDRGTCAPSLVGDLTASASPDFCFRVAVRSVESWLLADRNLAGFLGIGAHHLPRAPDHETDPKRALVRLASRSPHRVIREGVGGDPSDHRPGGAYNAALAKFVDSEWDPQDAATRSDSLDRALRAVARIANA